MTALKKSEKEGKSIKCNDEKLKINSSNSSIDDTDINLIRYKEENERQFF